MSAPDPVLLMSKVGLDFADKPRASDSRGYRIKPGKFSGRLLPENLDPGLRRKIWIDEKLDEGGFLRMAPEYALSYMSRLASFVADNDKLTAYTDLKWSRDIVVDRYVDRADDGNVGNNEARLATLSFNTIRIGSQVTLAEVIRFRDEKHNLLKRYRKAIHSMALQVTGAGYENAQEREMQRILKDVFKPAHEELSAKLGEARIDFGLSILQAIGSAGVGALFGGIPGAVVGGLLSMGFSAVKWRIAQDRTRCDKPMTYLVELRKRFHEDTNKKI